MDAATKAKNDYWNKRLKRAAVATAPTLEAFVTELNRRVQSDAAYCPGVRFLILRSAGAPDTATWEGPAEARPLVSRILHGVTQDFEMPAPFQMDPVRLVPALTSDGDDAAPVGSAP
jgi:hypothetical protein